MKRSAFTLIAFLAMTGVASASVVTLDIVNNGVPKTGLRSYTLTATGTGIVALGEFMVAKPNSDPTELGTVYQDFQRNSSGPHIQTEFDLSNPDPSDDYDPDIDSFVLFGDQRYPDMIANPVWPFDGERPDCYTTETLDDLDPVDDTKGWGTLNNSFGGYDVYMLEGEPTEVEETVELMQLVLPYGEGFNARVYLTLYTATNFDPINGEVDLKEHALVYPRMENASAGDCDRDGDCDFDDFVAFGTGWFGPDGDGATNPEPPASWETGDFDDDGDVDYEDFIYFGIGWFGPRGDGGTGAAVPEPGTVVMLIAGGLCLAAICLRKKNPVRL